MRAIVGLIRTLLLGACVWALLGVCALWALTYHQPLVLGTTTYATEYNRRHLGFESAAGRLLLWERTTYEEAQWAGGVSIRRPAARRPPPPGEPDVRLDVYFAPGEDAPGRPEALEDRWGIHRGEQPLSRVEGWAYVIRWRAVALPHWALAVAVLAFPVAVLAFRSWRWLRGRGERDRPRVVGWFIGQIVAGLFAVAIVGVAAGGIRSLSEGIDVTFTDRRPIGTSAGPGAFTRLWGIQFARGSVGGLAITDQSPERDRVNRRAYLSVTFSVPPSKFEAEPGDQFARALAGVVVRHNDVRSGTATRSTLTFLALPAWLAVLLLCLPILPALNPVLRARRSAARVRRGLCGACGYDLRTATAGVCPECGEPIPNPTGI